ncbi:MAG: type II toxin-antitoxin system mRNA interferase toxin, RelE/StbE family [Methanolobus sp.]|nr:type II toxin-antitoxin system mRNA interferase toxin, RelE/StbE family [Methanolobus sp.]
MSKKVQQIIRNPYHYKPLLGDLYGARRVHIDSSFVLIYEIDEDKKAINILDYDHHDVIY